MVNPLSRVAMKNIIEEKNEKQYVQRNVKTLGDFVKEKEVESISRSNNSFTNRKESNTNNNYNTNRTVDNTNIKADVEISGLIKNVINGEVKVKKQNSVDTAITLEEAAEKTKR